MKNLALALFVLLLLTCSAASLAQYSRGTWEYHSRHVLADWEHGITDERCTVRSADRYACVERKPGGEYVLRLRARGRSRTEELPGDPNSLLMLGAIRDLVYVRGVDPVPGGGGLVRSWNRTIGLGGTLMARDEPVEADRMAPTGEWLAVQRVDLSPEAVIPGPGNEGVMTKEPATPLVVLRWDGKEVRRVPGRRVFMNWPEDEDDDFAFSHDGKALLVYRALRREFDLYGLDGRAADEVVPLADLAPGYAAHEFEFIDVDRIVIWQQEFFGRQVVDWLRVLSRDRSGRFVSKVISYGKEGRSYVELHDISPARGWLLLSADTEPYGVKYDVVDLSGRLIWRHDYRGWSELLGAMPDRDLREWIPSLLHDGAVELEPNRPRADELVVVRLTEVEKGPQQPVSTVGEVVVRSDDSPLAQAASIVEVPRAVAVDGSGQYALADFAEGPRPLDAERIVAKPPVR